MVANAEYPKKAGIYKFTCRNNGKIYIGKSVCLSVRLASHKQKSKTPVGKYLFEKALVKHGWDSFDIEIIEIFEGFDKNNEDDKLKIVEREAFYIAMYDSTNPTIGYNNCKFGTDRTGTHGPLLSEETRKKMSLAQRGRKMSEESKLKMSLSSKGRPKSKEHIEKCRLSRLGKKHSEETKKKMSQSSKRLKMSEEHKEKMRQIHTGREITEETREKMRESQKGKGNHRGYIHSDETRKKMRASRLAFMAKMELKNLKNEVENTL